MIMDGVIVINKPFGKTSHDMVSFLRRTLGIKKVGHTGTLDPAATGVLPLCIGKATKAAELLTAEDKSYRAEIVFGMTTDTLDAEGEILTEQPYEYVTKDELWKQMQNFIGEIYQIPPMFSAIKKDGKKLYELARNGVTIEREKRKVRIDRLELLSYDAVKGIAQIEADCSKGTYIRTLCEDIGAQMGCGAYMNKLVRTKSGKFTLDKSYIPQEVENAAKENRISELLIPLDELFADLPCITLNEKQTYKVVNGARINIKGFANGDYRVYSNENKFISVSEFCDGVLRLKKAFWQ